MNPKRSRSYKFVTVLDSTCLSISTTISPQKFSSHLSRRLPGSNRSSVKAIQNSYVIPTEHSIILVAHFLLRIFYSSMKLRVVLMNHLEFLDECKTFLLKIFLQMASGLKSTFSKQKYLVHALQHLKILLKHKDLNLFSSSVEPLVLILYTIMVATEKYSKSTISQVQKAWKN